MVVLRNIKRNDNLIEADYFPENDNAKGHISVDTVKNEIIDLIKAKGYEHSSAPLHAKNELLKLSAVEKLPQERTVMWY